MRLLVSNSISAIFKASSASVHVDQDEACPGECGYHKLDASNYYTIDSNDIFLSCLGRFLGG